MDVNNYESRVHQEPTDGSNSPLRYGLLLPSTISNPNETSSSASSSSSFSTPRLPPHDDHPTTMIVRDEHVISSEVDLSECSQYSIDKVRKYFHLPMIEASNKLGLCLSMFKKLCRMNGIARWPYRQIRSITKSIRSIEMFTAGPSLSAEESETLKQHLLRMQQALEQIIKDPNTIISVDVLAECDGISKSYDSLDANSLNSALEDDISGTQSRFLVYYSIINSPLFMRS